MDDNTLLKTAINLHYHDRPEIIANAVQVIQNYCKQEQTDFEYDEVLKTIHDLMNDLPSNILLYFLTTVPLPKQKSNGNSAFSELMKKSRASLLDNMHSILTDYLANAMPPLIAINTKKSDIPCDKKTISKDKMEFCENANEDAVIYSASPFPQSTLDVVSKSFKTLLDICADYVVLNLNELQQFYYNKNEQVWNLVNKNVCSTAEQSWYYTCIEDINKKLKWLRMIEDGHIPVDVIRELYGKSEIFLKEQHLYNIVDDDAFTVCKELKEAIDKFVSN